MLELNSSTNQLTASEKISSNIENSHFQEHHFATEYHESVTPILFHDNLIVVYICVTAYVVLKKMWNEVVEY